MVVHLGVMCGALLYVHNTGLKGGLRPRVLLLIGLPLVVFTGAGLTERVAVRHRASPVHPGTVAVLVAVRDASVEAGQHLRARDGYSRGAARVVADSHHARTARGTRAIPIHLSPSRWCS